MTANTIRDNYSVYHKDVISPDRKAARAGVNADTVADGRNPEKQRTPHERQVLETIKGDLTKGGSGPAQVEGRQRLYSQVADRKVVENVTGGNTWVDKATGVERPIHEEIAENGVRYPIQLLTHTNPGDEGLYRGAIANGHHRALAMQPGQMASIEYVEDDTKRKHGYEDTETGHLGKWAGKDASEVFKGERKDV